MLFCWSIHARWSSATVIHNEFGLTLDKIAATISDNGSNFVKAFKEFSVAIVHSRDRPTIFSDRDQDKEKMLSKMLWLWSLWF